MYFFDHNATTPLLPEAQAAWLQGTDTCWLNCSSPYRAAAQVHVQMEAARNSLSELLGVGTERLILNSGATEGNNAVFSHWARTLPPAAQIGVSPTEHPSVLLAAKHYFGTRVVWLGLDVNGAIDLVRLTEQLQAGVFAAVSVMAANNETGIINPWQSIARLCRQAECFYHCDASQWVGKMPLVELAQCDFVTGCSHKFGGPRGVGFCLVPYANGGFISLLGGGQESGRRAGTEDVPGLLAMLAALRMAVSHSLPPQSGLTDFLSCLDRSSLKVQVVGMGVPRLWNTVALVMPEFGSVRWIRALERRGFLVSSGSACSSGASPVLVAMGYSSGVSQRVVRISSSWSTCHADWQALAAAMIDAYAELQRDAAASVASVISI